MVKLKHLGFFLMVVRQGFFLLEFSVVVVKVVVVAALKVVVVVEEGVVVVGELEVAVVGEEVVVEAEVKVVELVSQEKKTKASEPQAENAVEGTDRKLAVPCTCLGLVEIYVIYPPFSLLHPKD